MTGSTAAPSKTRGEKNQAQSRAARHMERPKSAGNVSRGPATPNERSRSALRTKKEVGKPAKHMHTLMEIQNVMASISEPPSACAGPQNAQMRAKAKQAATADKCFRALLGDLIEQFETLKTQYQD